MKQKITAMLLTAVMIMMLVPCAFAETVAAGECGEYATWTLDDEGTLTISGTGIADTDGWRRKNAEDIKKVVVEEGITELGDSLIRNLTNMTQISMPDSLIRIGDGNFRNCSALTSLRIPSGVRSIEDIALMNCTALASLTVDSANEYYKAVGNVLYTKDGKELDAYPPALNNTSYTVPEGTEVIDSSVFNGASKLKTVNIPSTVTDIYCSFTGCSALERIEVAENNESYMSENGILFTNDKTRLCTYSRVRDGAYTIPGGVVFVDDEAFAGNKGLSAVTIPDSVKVIREEVFRDCTALEEIYLPSNVVTIDDGVFSGCTSLVRAVIDANTDRISWNMFDGCTELSEVKLPESGLETIKTEAFRNCRSLSSIVIPEGVNYIDDHAFERSGLEEIYLPSTISGISYYAFQSTPITDVYYNGTASEWENIEIYDGNSHLTRATIHYTAKPYVNEDLQYDAEAGTVTVPIRPTSLDCVLVAAAYNNNTLLNINTKTLAKEADSDSITITADGADEIVVYIWDGLNGLVPMCESKSITVE